MIPPALSADAVVAAARACRFTLVGLAPAAPLDPTPFLHWLEAGYGTGLSAMHRRVTARLDPGAVVPGARTVVALGIPYGTGEETAGQPERPVIARYARGRDYHLAHRDRMRALRRSLLDLDPTVNTYACVDAGVAMEKAWAERAGLGWIGKHGVLVNRQHGSWFTLSVMVLNRSLDHYDQPHPRLCGDCDLCLRACPTGAFPCPGVVDARLCLSYQTVENHDAIPVALRGAMAGRAFGCDACQEACPHNHGGLPPGDPRQAARPLGLMSATEIATLGHDEFSRLAAGTPMARAGYHGLRRNAALALASDGRPSARAALDQLSRDTDPVVSEAAQWALRHSPRPRGRTVST
jgi:epoxyqueuosine reductase